MYFLNKYTIIKSECSSGDIIRTNEYVIYNNSERLNLTILYSHHMCVSVCRGILKNSKMLPIHYLIIVSITSLKKTIKEQKINICHVLKFDTLKKLQAEILKHH